MSQPPEFEAAVRAQAAGRLAEAEALYKDILARVPDHAGALANLAVIARRAGRPSDALAYLTLAARLPDAPGEVFFNLGNLHADRGEPDRAIAALETAIVRAPELGRAHMKLGLLLHDCGRPEASIEALVRAAQLMEPNEPALSAGTAAPRAAALLWSADKWPEAIGLFKAIAAARPEEIAAHLNLGLALVQASHHLDALAAFRRVQTIDPDNSDAAAAIPNCLINTGEQEKAYQAYEAALANPATRAGTLSAYCMAILYDGARSPAEKLQVHRDLTADWRLPDPPARPTRRPGAARSLRIGYVTADFTRAHPVAQFIAPVLKAHAEMGIAQTAYLNAGFVDGTTSRMKDLVRTVNVAGWPDDHLANQIRQDGIDLLIDLSGHTRGNRLAMFAHHPAPVTASMIGYPHSTGFAAIDYLVADKETVPEALSAGCSEAILRLPHSFLCFAPPPGMPVPEGRHPEGPPVFGSLNHLPKLGPETIALWADVLKAVPHARLLLKCGAFSEGPMRERFRDRFAECGIAPGRLIFEEPQAFGEAMGAYERFDIALDPIPYNGGTTTAHALWMGVPVVTLTGGNFCGRMGRSLLAAAGCASTIAGDPDGYVAVATRLAGEVDRLRRDRRALHAAVRTSPLCDVAAYSEALAELYRSVV
ncbi:MAG: tetratricopeptide repeat protein [Alphaproteobacteria bacterium]|nr:tetratricopeptide repeat protein [Alphaproteobacteria bacterium]